MVNRNFFRLILLIGLIVLSIEIKAQKEAKEQEWKSIAVLQTTRAEVEKQFGKSAKGWEKGMVLYELEHYNLLVLYSKGCTGKNDEDYNVPLDTVTHFTVYLKKEIPLSIINIDKMKFEKTVLPPNFSLSSMDEGVTYRISADEMWLISIDYYPKKEQYKFKCQKRLCK